MPEESWSCSVIYIEHSYELFMLSVYANRYVSSKLHGIWITYSLIGTIERLHNIYIMYCFV